MRGKLLACWILIKWRFKYRRWYWRAFKSLWHGVSLTSAVSYDGYSRYPIEDDISVVAARYVVNPSHKLDIGQELVVVDGCPKCGFDVDVRVGYSVRCRHSGCDYEYTI